MSKSILKDKSYEFALEIVKLARYLQSEKNEFVLSRQILKSGTAIGALIREAEFGQSKADFTHKMSISLQEANETDYWLCILRDSGYANPSRLSKLQNDCKELIAMLTSTVKTARK